MDRVIAEQVVSEILFDQQDIRQAIARCKDWFLTVACQELCVFYNLEGGKFFAERLVQMLASCEIEQAFIPIKTSSYGNRTISSGDVKIISEGFRPEMVQGRRVVLLDDILDSGATMHALRELMLASGAKDVHICVLLERLIDRQIEIEADFAGLKTARTEFLVGAGLDYKGQLRDLPYIATLR